MAFDETFIRELRDDCPEKLIDEIMTDDNKVLLSKLVNKLENHMPKYMRKISDKYKTIGVDERMYLTVAFNHVINCIKEQIKNV